MANQSPRSLRTAAVGNIRFNLSEFHLGLGRCIGEPYNGRPGNPGDHLAVFTEEPLRALTSYLQSELLSKFDDGTPNVAKEEETWKRFHAAERSCFETNQRLAVSGFTGPYEQVILLARKLAARILGRFDWDVVANGFGWGPGASTRQPRRMSDAAFKFTGNPDTTIGNAILAETAIRCIPSWYKEVPFLGQGLGKCVISPGNRIVTVPKNYKTDRTIAIEPCMNMYIQKGIGAAMRNRLRLYGCNLDDQTRNQRLARVGSISGLLATIDLSMASDMISRELVSKFIRHDWLEALEQSRSPFGVLPSGEKIFYQKFSSMGNGFTFELESLIFYSLALAWTHICGAEVHRVSVYGDDIILPSAVADGFCGLLQFVGFKPNEKKSYWTGPFRESCGKHYFRGHDVTPFYVRRPVRKLTDLFLLHNNLYRWEKRSAHLLGPSKLLELARLRKWVRSYAPARWRKPRLFDGYGDGAFIGVFDEVLPKQAAGGIECWEVSVMSDVSRKLDTDMPGLLPKALCDLMRRARDHHGYPMVEPSGVLPSSGERVKEIKILIPQYAT